MARFGWAFINCSGSASDQTHGPAYSVQYVTSSAATSTTGSAYFKYFTGSATGFAVSTLVLSGNMIITGALSASRIHYEDITNIDATGSTFFGDTNNDMHERTGSLVVSLASGQYILSASVTNRRTHVRGFGAGYRRILGSAALTNYDYIIGCSGSGHQVLYLPTASVVGTGSMLIIKDEYRDRGSTYVQISAAVGTGNKIDGRADYALTGTLPAINLYTDGANWFVF
tara:strand:- start:11070 stop:11753 length:684 start_codon:yes stop_codon:yes gene_type:complete